MKKDSKGRIEKIASIALLAMLLLAPAVSAALIGDSFAGLFLKMDRFFANEGYKPYTKAIDFFFFTLLFVSLYLVVIKYAFKENTRPVRFIAILLGLMTGFLFTMGGYTTAKLLPYIPWFLFALLAGFIYYILGQMGMKHGLWRFLLALILAGLIVFLLSYLLFPESDKFSAFFGPLGTISIPTISAPGSPFNPPSYGAGSGYGPGSGSIFPTAPPAGTFSFGGMSGMTWFWLTLAIVFVMVLSVWGIRNRNNLGNWRIRRMIRDLQREIVDYQNGLQGYVRLLNQMLSRYRVHGINGQPDAAARIEADVLASLRASNRERGRLNRLEGNINRLTNSITRHRRFHSLDAQEQAAVATMVGTIYRRFGQVTMVMVHARRQYMGPSARAVGVRLP